METKEVRMLEVVWSLIGVFKIPLLVIGLSVIGVACFFQIWKIQLEKAYVRYTEMVYNHGLSLKKAEKLFMQISFGKDSGTKGEHEEVRRLVKRAIKDGRLIKIEFTYEGEMSVRYFAHDEDLHSFRALMIKQAKWIKFFSFFRPFNIYRFTLHDLEFKKAIEQ